MARVFRFFIITIALSWAANSAATNLSEDEVKSFLAALSQSTSSLEVSAIANAFSDDAQITINISFQGQQQALTPSKAEYINMLKQSWSLYKDYQYQRSNQKINMADNQAIVIADIRESMNIDGQVILGSSQEEVIIKSVNGQLQVIQMIVNSKQ